MRIPLALLPKGLVIPIVFGPAKRKRWIIGSSDHSCWLGIYERSEVNQFADVVRTLPKGAVIFDFGAHSGYFSLVAVSTNPDVVIHAFEPSFRNEFLAAHIRLNSIRNIHLHRCAVGREETDVSFNGYAIIQEDSINKSEFKEKGVVRQIAIDQEIQKGHLPYPDLIKMDIEGAEVEALLGMMETLSKSKPKIFLSMHSDQLRTDCLNLLERMGYQFKRIDEEGFLQMYAWVDPLPKSCGTEKSSLT